MSTMADMSKIISTKRHNDATGAEMNFMGGVSYSLTPLETMKMVTASSIFGEPQYYRAGEFAEGFRQADARNTIDPLFKKYSVLGTRFDGMKTSEIMETVIDEALDDDFDAVLNWAVTLRSEFLMRLNPQVILVRAAMHPGRAEFNASHPGLFSEIERAVMQRADEPASQLTYYLYKTGSKKNLPNILKRCWAQRLAHSSRYEIAKYKNACVGMIDLVRISHARGPIIDELMKTGTVAFEEDNSTWEAARSAGRSWRDILEHVRMGHMALLRNLRGIFTEIDDAALCRKTLDELKAGVPGGKQFPFRYWSAHKMILASVDVHHQALILDALEECMDIACGNMPKLPGRTMCLSDNSGSAWGGFTSEYGSVTVAEIDNLSSVIAARNAEEGYVGKFGDKLITFPASKRGGVLAQTKEITKGRSDDVGGSTENGIWLFLDDAIRKKQHWDNIFLYSDMQAGHGGLYGTPDCMKKYEKAGFSTGYSGRYIDVAKLVDAYRQQVNPKVNVFMIQTAGYTNIAVPEYGYRTNCLYGWTGKELLFAVTMNRFWDDYDRRRDNGTI